MIKVEEMDADMDDERTGIAGMKTPKIEALLSGLGQCLWSTFTQFSKVRRATLRILEANFNHVCG